MDDLLLELRHTLMDRFTKDEVRTYIFIIMKEVCGLKPYQILLDKDVLLSSMCLGKKNFLICSLL